MAGIKATVTTKSMEPQPTPQRVRKSDVDKIDLTKCGSCGKKISAFVQADNRFFCNDTCVAEYLA